jgi:hypothetical protein
MREKRIGRQRRLQKKAACPDSRVWQRARHSQARLQRRSAVAPLRSAMLDSGCARCPGHSAVGTKKRFSESNKETAPQTITDLAEVNVMCE